VKAVIQKDTVFPASKYNKSRQKGKNSTDKTQVVTER
jgi:hypothetical protein